MEPTTLTIFLSIIVFAQVAAISLLAWRLLTVERAVSAPRETHPGTDAAAIITALLSANTTRDAAFFAASQQIIDKALVQMQGTMQIMRNTQVVGGVPLELEMQRAELDLEKQRHIRKQHEEQFEAFRLAQQAGMVPRAKPTANHPLA